MALKNVKSELDAVFKQLEVYGEAKYFILRKSPQINKAVRASINASISASAAIGEKKQDMLNDAQENAEKAGKILVDLQKRLKEDYGKHWRQDLITSAIFFSPEQEIVEAFALLAIIKQTEIPSRIIHFRTQDPDSYLKTKTSLKVSGEAYIFGLLDCVGELNRVMQDSLNRPEFAKRVFAVMQELFGELERFMAYTHISNLKHRIDICRKQTISAKKLLK